MIIYLLGTGPRPSFASRSFKQDKATERHRVPKDLEGCDLGPEQEHGARNQQYVLEDTSKCQNQPASCSHQEYSSDVEQESNGSVRNENQRSNTSQFIKGGEPFGEREDKGVDKRANRCIIMKRNERVHFEPMEEKLNHDKPRGLEGDGSSLGDESNEIEVQLSVGGEGDTGGNHEDDDSELLVRLLYAECPRDQENGNGGEGLKHLNIGNTEVEISGVAQDQTRAEQEANGEDRADKHVLGDIDVLCSIQEVSGAL